MSWAMKTVYKSLLFVFLFAPLLWAEDLGFTVVIDPTTKRVTEYTYGRIVLTHVALSVQQVPSSVIQAIPQKYLIWHDLNADTLLTANEIESMTTSEKDAVEAPLLAEQVRKQAFADEVAGTTGNDLCNAELDVLTTKIDTWVANRQAELDTTTNFTQAKAHLRDQLYPVLRTVFKRIARCVRGRAQ